MDDLIEAFQIFSKYMSEKDKRFPTHCEHDTLQVSCNTKEMAPEDLTRLKKLGFLWSSSEECPGWISYRFGKA